MNLHTELLRKIRKHFKHEIIWKTEVFTWHNEVQNCIQSFNNHIKTSTVNINSVLIFTLKNSLPHKCRLESN